MKEPISKRTKHFYSFAPFRLYVAERELFRGTELVALTPKALDTLLLLLNKRGHVVEKGELMGALWPDTFVEEANLLFQISQLRKALGKRPQGQPYIRTVARRGYRFDAPVTDSWEEEPQEPQLAVAGMQGQEAGVTGRKRLAWILAAACVLFIGAGLAVWLLLIRPGASPPGDPLVAVPLTSLPGMESWPSFSPDGNEVAFNWNGETRTTTTFTLN